MTPDASLEIQRQAAQRQLDEADLVVVVKYDLRNFSKWGPAVAERLPEGEDTLRKVLAGGRTIIDGLYPNANPVLVEGSLDKTTMVFAYETGKRAEAFQEILASIRNIRSSMTMHPTSPEKQLQTLKSQNKSLESMVTDTDPRIVIAIDGPEGAHTLGRPIDESDARRPLYENLDLVDKTDYSAGRAHAAHAATAILEHLRNERAGSGCDVFVTKKSLETITGDKNPERLKALLAENGMNIREALAIQKGDKTYLTYGIALGDPFKENAKRKMKAELEKRTRNKTTYIARTVDTALRGKKTTRRKFFGANCRLDQNTYHTFLENIVRLAEVFETQSRGQIGQIAITADEAKQLQRTLTDYETRIYMDQGESEADARVYGSAPALRRLKKMTFTPPERAGEPYRYRLTNADKEEIQLAKRSIFAATMLLATTSTNLREGASIKEWTDSVSYAQENMAYIAGSDAARLLRETDDEPTLTRATKIFGPDILESILIESLLQTDSAVRLHSQTDDGIMNPEDKQHLEKVRDSYILEKAYLGTVAGKR